MTRRYGMMTYRVAGWCERTNNVAATVRSTVLRLRHCCATWRHNQSRSAAATNSYTHHSVGRGGDRLWAYSQRRACAFISTSLPSSFASLLSRARLQSTNRTIIISIVILGISLSPVVFTWRCARLSCHVQLFSPRRTLLPYTCSTIRSKYSLATVRSQQWFQATCSRENSTNCVLCDPPLLWVSSVLTSTILQ